MTERWLALAAFILAVFATVLILFETYTFQNRILTLERQIAVNETQIDWINRYGGDALRAHHFDPVSRAHPIPINEFACVKHAEEMPREHQLREHE